MARKTKRRPTKRVIYVFWEGQSEKEYARFLKGKFAEHAVIYIHREKGLFHTAKAVYRGDKRFKNNVAEIDEIWFFFDAEIEKGGQWQESISCIDYIMRSRVKNPSRVRLLMTSCCLEYWLLLHYKRTRPTMASPSDKERIMVELKSFMPSYEKANAPAIFEIARNYTVAVENGRWLFECLYKEGMPEQEKKRNEWLFSATRTFTTVHEAVEALMRLPDF